jgi:hypothetical protein
MSTRNGDRARARREQQKKLLRRQRSRDLRQDLQTKSPVAAAPDSVTAEPKTAPTD